MTRIYTPGSLYEESLIGSDASALLCSLLVTDESTAIAMIDASTGQAWAVAFKGEGRWASLYDEIMRWNPSELVVSLEMLSAVNSFISLACLIPLL